jgi:hypothetical protein
VKSSSLPWPTENPRARAEWDFRPTFLPENEVWWCHCYEIARICQTQGWRDDIEEFRRDSGGNTYDAFWLKAEKCFQTLKRVEWPSIFYTLWPEWPVKPYLSVNAKDRKTRINDWCRGEKPEVLEQVSLRDLLRDHSDRFTRLRVQLSLIGRRELPERTEVKEVGDTIPEGMSEIIAFRIPGYTTDRELVEMFKEWLKLRKTKPGEKTEHLGAGAPVKLMRADLCAIGFWRLVRSGLRRQHSINLTCEVSGRNLFSANPSSWTRAMKRAKKLIGYSIGKEFKS